MNISRLTANVGGRAPAGNVARQGRDIDTTAKEAPARSSETASRNEEPGVVQRSSARVAAFESSVEARFDQILKSGDLDPRQAAAVEQIKGQFSSMLHRLDAAFYGKDGLDGGGASDALKNILSLTGSALESVLGPQGEGPIAPVEHPSGGVDTVA